MAADAGLIGKLPAHGDFVRRGARPEVVTTLERWLEQELGGAVAAGIELGAAVDGLDGWRFACLDPAAGRFLAVAVASEDKVGRRFPLVGWLVPAINPDAAGGLGDIDIWCDASALALAAARDRGLDADAALAALQTIDAPALDDAQPTGWWRDRADTMAGTAATLPTGEAFLGLLGGLPA